MIKHTDEQPRYTGQGLEGPTGRDSVPVEVEGVTLPVYGCVHPPENFLKPLLWGIYGGFLRQT